MKRRTPKPPASTLQTKVEIQEIENHALAADLFQRILEAQERTLRDEQRQKAKEKKKEHPDEPA